MLYELMIDIGVCRCRAFIVLLKHQHCKVPGASVEVVSALLANLVSLWKSYTLLFFICCSFIVLNHLSFCVTIRVEFLMSLCRCYILQIISPEHVEMLPCRRDILYHYQNDTCKTRDRSINMFFF